MFSSLFIRQRRGHFFFYYNRVLGMVTKRVWTLHEIYIPTSILYSRLNGHSEDCTESQSIYKLLYPQGVSQYKSFA